VFRPKTSVLVLLLTALSMAQTALETESPQVERVAAKLHCSCGCNLNMDCKMDPWPCHLCRAAKEKIVKYQKAGMSDDAILREFVKESGPDVLVVEPGVFGSLSHYMGLGVGLLLLVWFVRRSMNKRAAAPEVDAALLQKYQDKIEKETAQLD
jgi:hypothetical protein